MSHIGTEKDWNGLLEFYAFSPDYVPTLKRVTIAQWIHKSRANENSAPGTSELAVNAINFAGLMFNERMRLFGAGKFELNGNVFCKFDDVEHFIDGFFHFIASGGYDKWHLLAHRPLDFVAHLEEKGFAGSDDQYAEKIKVIYDQLETKFGINIPEVKAVQHIVSHGDFLSKIASDLNADLDDIFKLGRDGAIHKGNDIGTLFTGDIVYVPTKRETLGGGQVGADPLAGLVACDRPKGDCAGRTHFVIHQTVDGNLTKNSVVTRFGGLRNKGHVYLLKSGESVFIWPFTEKLVRATKAESPNAFRPIHGSFPDFPIAGKLIHVEVDYGEQGKPNDAQYKALAGLYIEACKTVGRILTIVPHIEVDRGIRNGHNDPQNFDYNLFYSILSGKGIDITRIPKFDHERYFGKPNFRTPFDTDTFHFPPILKGNPHTG